MADEPNFKSDEPDATIPSRSAKLRGLKKAADLKQQAELEIEPSDAVIEAPIKSLAPGTPPVPKRLLNAPWMLRQHYEQELDLEAELDERFTGTMLMSQISFRNTGQKHKHGIATLSTQDGGARLLIDVDSVSGELVFSFQLGSMLTLGFSLSQLSDLDREHWLGRMRRQQGGLAFLWTESRWQKDYLIFVTKQYFTGVYAFSPDNTSAAARLTPDVTTKLLKWLEDYWTPTPDDNADPLDW